MHRLPCRTQCRAAGWHCPMHPSPEYPAKRRAESGWRGTPGVRRDTAPGFGHFAPPPRIGSGRAVLRLVGALFLDSTLSRRLRVASMVGQLARSGFLEAVATRDLSWGRLHAGPPAVPQLAAYAHVPDCNSPARWQDSNTFFATLLFRCHGADPVRSGTGRFIEPRAWVFARGSGNGVRIVAVINKSFKPFKKSDCR